MFGGTIREHVVDLTNGAKLVIREEELDAFDQLGGFLYIQYIPKEGVKQIGKVIAPLRPDGETWDVGYEFLGGRE